jgi:hypothetical protein
MTLKFEGLYLKCMGTKKNIYKLLVGISEGKGPDGKPWPRWNILNDLRVGCKDVTNLTGSIHGEELTFVKRVRKIRVQKKA